jgi:hypothetical protein
MCDSWRSRGDREIETRFADHIGVLPISARRPWTPDEMAPDPLLSMYGLRPLSHLDSGHRPSLVSTDECVSGNEAAAACPCKPGNDARRSVRLWRRCLKPSRWCRRATSLGEPQRFRGSAPLSSRWDPLPPAMDTIELIIHRWTRSTMGPSCGTPMAGSIVRHANGWVHHTGRQGSHLAKGKRDWSRRV